MTNYIRVTPGERDDTDRSGRVDPPEPPLHAHDPGASMTTIHLTVTALADRPVSEAITVRGRELAADATVRDAEALFASSSVKLIPVLDGPMYIGALSRQDIRAACPDEQVAVYASVGHPHVTASTTVADAVAVLGVDGSTRLIVVGDDGSTFVGLLCLRSDREHLCVDAECHPDAGPAIDPSAKVADIVLADPTAARVFERLGIDYCCGGRRPLADICSRRGLDVDDVVALLEEPRVGAADEADWRMVPLAGLVEHIVDVHHGYLRGELPALDTLAAKVARRHGDAHPELVGVASTFAELERELREHLAREETVVFPSCLALVDHADDGGGDVGVVVREMEDDHEAVAALLRRLRDLTDGYRPPADSCTSYRALFGRLAALEADIHRHVHEENNILFPRALALAADR